MSNTQIVTVIQNALNKGLLSEDKLAELVNSQLATEGLALSGTKVRRRHPRPEKKTATAKAAPKAAKTPKEKAPKADASPTGKRAKAPSNTPETTDGRKHWQAICVAIASFDAGCRSAELQEKLTSMGHPMGTAVFHTTLSNLQSKKEFVKSKGDKRSQVYTLSAAGKKAVASCLPPCY